MQSLAKALTHSAYLGRVEHRIVYVKYLDTGLRDHAQTLAHWFAQIIPEEVVELRIQTGFFSLEGIGLLIPVLEHCKERSCVTNLLIGSNEGGTKRNDIGDLVDLLGVPRPEAKLGIVSFRDAYFHPKTYHVRRVDGSEMGFVGSANLTRSGLALHVEAGIALDTRDGDPVQPLVEMANSIDEWFIQRRDGLNLIEDPDALDVLVENGILANDSPPPPPRSETPSSSGVRHIAPRLQQLVSLPRVRRATVEVESPEEGAEPVNSAEEPAIAVTEVSVPRAEYPQNMLFKPSADAPTEGASALSGGSLPGGATGLIIRLNRDSARRFMGGSGTANISIPIPIVYTLRFGMYSGRNNIKRPRAEFDMNLRFLCDGTKLGTHAAKTNVMAYGYAEDDTGHQDMRMLVPAAVSNLIEEINAAGKSLPTEGHMAFLEWPQLESPSFRLSFLEASSEIFRQAREIFQAEQSSKRTVGNGACWLPVGLSPSW